VGRNYGHVEELIDESAAESFGGIQTKGSGARTVSEHGLPAVIAQSTEPDVLEKIATEKPVGTIFIPINGGHNE